jgi:hypothetical protein
MITTIIITTTSAPSPTRSRIRTTSVGRIRPSRLLASLSYQFLDLPLRYAPIQPLRVPFTPND